MSEQPKSQQSWVLRGLLAIASFTMWLLSFGFIRRWLVGKIDKKKGKIVDAKIVD